MHMQPHSYNLVIIYICPITCFSPAHVEGSESLDICELSGPVQDVRINFRNFISVGKDKQINEAETL